MFRSEGMFCKEDGWKGGKASCVSLVFWKDVWGVFGNGEWTAGVP